MKRRSLLRVVTESMVGASAAAAPAPQVHETVGEILLEREIRGLFVPVISRICLGLIGVFSLLYTAKETTELSLDTSALYVFLGLMLGATGLNVFFLALLRIGRYVTFVGLLGAGVDTLVIALTFILTFHYSRFTGLSPGILFKTEIPVIITGFVVVNGLALRPRYPLIVGTAATGSLLLTALYTAVDPLAAFSSDLHQTMAGPALDVPQLVTTVLFVAAITLAVTTLTAAVRRTIRRAITSELENARLHREQLEVVMREKVEALGRLVAGVSHEINNPLGVAISGVDTQRRALVQIQAELPADSGKGRRAVAAATSVLDSVAEALGRIEATEHSLRAFAHLDQGAVQRVHLADEIATSVSLLPADLDAPNRLTVEVPDDLPSLDVRAREVNLMLMALIRRAFESLPDGTGEVSIRAQSADDSVVIRISDTGPGLDESARRSLFDVTLRRHGPRVSADFDLPAALAIAHRHRGDISVASELGGGTTFTVRLPVGAPASE